MHEDYPTDWREPTVTGCWRGEHRARKHHDCVRRSPHCPGEICRGEIYQRTAVLDRTPWTRGTVRVERACQACASFT